MLSLRKKKSPPIYDQFTEQPLKNGKEKERVVTVPKQTQPQIKTMKPKKEKDTC